MNTNTASEIKKSGATFTPAELSIFLASKLLALAGSSLDVLDPACGDGSLLSAIYRLGGNRIKSLTGYDTNQSYLHDAKLAISQVSGDITPRLQCSDFLSVCPNVIDLFSISTQREFADLIIANPPYVRTQVLGAAKAQQLAHDFNLTGRVDLYYPFLMAMTNALKKGGLLGVITSNRYLTTKSGSDIRKYLLDNYDIIEVIDLGDTKLFDAAVLPAIFIGRKKETKTTISKVGKYTSIYEADADDESKALFALGSIYDVLKSENPGSYMVDGQKYILKKGLLKHPADKTGIWQMSNPIENEWIETINAHAAFRVKDKFKVRVGIKSCADNVFITQQWRNEGYAIEEDLLCPMISQENIEAWKINRESMLDILYPHYSDNGKRLVYDIENYPNAKQYLEGHREQLEGRNYVIKAGRKWYEYWVPQNPASWKLPKVVFPDISVRPRFCFDESGAVVNGNCYWMCATNEEEKDLLLLIEGVSNSDVMITYHDLCFNNKLYSGRRRYLSQYIEQYPMPDPKTDVAQDIIAKVREINEATDNSQIVQLRADINNLVKRAFGLTD